MSTAIAIAETSLPLPALIDRAAAALTNARTAAEVLEARDMASFAYDAAKKAARLSKAKQAHDEVVGAAYRAQADASEIEAQAKRRIADEYDAAQERGEVRGHGNRSDIPVQNVTVSDLGFTSKEIHEARIIRDAEIADPGIVRRTLDAAIASGEEPSRSKVRRAALEVARPQAAKPTVSRGKDAIRERVLEAIVILSGLPPAEEVVGYFAGTDTSILISERLPTASEWLAAFNHEWTAHA